MRDILKVVNTLTLPPPPVVEEVSEVGEMLPVSADLIQDGSTTELKPLQPTSKRVLALEAKFTMGECSLVVKHKEDKDHIAGESLLRASFFGLVADFQMSNHDTGLDMELSRYLKNIGCI